MILVLFVSLLIPILSYSVIIAPFVMIGIFAFWSVISLWFLFFTDRDSQLAFSERFGWGVKRMKNKVVWLTGATSSIGEALAYELAKVGAKIVLTTKHMERLDGIKQRCIDVSNGKLNENDVLVLPFEQASEEHVVAVVRHFGSIDVVVSNTGMLGLGEAAETPIDVDETILDANFFAFVQLSRFVLKQFLRQKEGQFVVLSSIGGKLGIPGQAAYCASKHAQRGYFDALRLEFQKNHVFVTIVCPSFFKTIRPILTGSEIPEFSPSNNTNLDQHAVASERVAYLILVATINKLYESRIAKQPLLLSTFLARYFPDFHKCVMQWIFTKKRLTEINEGKWPKICSWEPFYVL